jgi:hypothetical protein
MRVAMHERAFAGRAFFQRIEGVAHQIEQHLLDLHQIDVHGYLAVGEF